MRILLCNHTTMLPAAQLRISRRRILRCAHLCSETAKVASTKIPIKGFWLIVIWFSGILPLLPLFHPPDNSPGTYPSAPMPF